MSVSVPSRIHFHGDSGGNGDKKPNLLLPLTYITARVSGPSPNKEPSFEKGPMSLSQARNIKVCRVVSNRKLVFTEKSPQLNSSCRIQLGKDTSTRCGKHERGSVSFLDGNRSYGEAL